MDLFNDAVTLLSWAWKSGPDVYAVCKRILVEVPGLDVPAVEHAIKSVDTSSANCAVDAEIDRLDK